MRFFFSRVITSLLLALFITGTFFSTAMPAGAQAVAQCQCSCQRVDGSFVTEGFDQFVADLPACDAECDKVGESIAAAEGGTQSVILTPACTSAVIACNTGADCPLGQFCNNNFCSTTAPAPSTQTGPNASPSGADILAGANPIKATDVRQALGRVITIFTGISGTIALAMFIYGGLMFLLSGGDDAKVAKAQGVFKWATLGLVVIFTSYAVVNQVFVALDQQFGSNTTGIAYPDIYPLGQITPAVLVGKVIQYVLGLVGVIALLIFIWGGFQYFLSVGDAKRAEAGRKTLVYAVIGLVMIFVSYAATTFIINTLNKPLSGPERPQTGTIPTPLNPEEEAGNALNPGGTTDGGTTGGGGTITPPPSVGGACGNCVCSVLVPGSGGEPATIQERPQGNVGTIGQCSTRCKTLTGFIRSQCF